MAEHRVSMLSASLRRYEDPARSADPKIRELVTQLATLEPAPAPRAHFRAELRAQLVAVAPRLIAEGPAAVAPAPLKQPSAPAHAAPTPVRSKLGELFGRGGKIPIARPLGVLTAVVAVFAVLLGGAVWISKKALPGDALYSLKRANENVQLSFATGDEAKGREYLSFAQTRAREVSALLTRTSAMAAGSGPSAGGISAHTATLIGTTLNAADFEVRSASQLLTGQAVRNGTPGTLSIMTAWAPGQIARLQQITNRLTGPGALHDRAESSLELTAAAFARAKALKAVIGCDCMTRAATDQFGPVPCPVCTSTEDPGGPAGPSGTAPAPGTTGGSPSTSTAPGKPGSRAPPSSSRTAPSGGGTTSGTDGTSPGGLPLPTILPSLPGGSSTGPSTPGDSSAEQTCVLDLLGICLHL